MPSIGPRARWLAPLLIVLVTAGIYVNTLSFGFVYDDNAQFVTSAYVHSWKFVPRYFQEHVWSHHWLNSPGSYYRPVFLLWLLVNYSLFGLNPFWWHLAIVVTHLLSTLLFY